MWPLGSLKSAGSVYPKKARRERHDHLPLPVAAPAVAGELDSSKSMLFSSREFLAELLPFLQNSNGIEDVSAAANLCLDIYAAQGLAKPMNGTELQHPELIIGMTTTLINIMLSQQTAERPAEVAQPACAPQPTVLPQVIAPVLPTSGDHRFDPARMLDIVQKPEEKPAAAPVAAVQAPVEAKAPAEPQAKADSPLQEGLSKPLERLSAKLHKLGVDDERMSSILKMQKARLHTEDCIANIQNMCNEYSPGMALVLIYENLHYVSGQLDYRDSAKDITKHSTKKVAKEYSNLISAVTKELGLQSKKALEDGKPKLFGEIMHEHWEHKRKRSQEMSNPQIDKWYELGRNNGAIGGKLVGAGGGGFLMFYADDRTRLKHAMTQAGLEEVRFKFDFEGTKVVFT